MFDWALNTSTGKYPKSLQIAGIINFWPIPLFIILPLIQY